MRVAAIFLRFGPYHIARLEAAGRQLAAAGHELVGIESASVGRVYAWDSVSGGQHFKKVTLFKGAVYEDIPKQDVCDAVRKVLTETGPDVIALLGWSFREPVTALQWALRHDVPTIMMSESSRSDFPRRWWLERIKKAAVGCCNAGLVGGSRHADYLVELGMSRDRIFLGYDAIDNDYFRTRADAVREQERSLRKRYELPSRFFLGSSRFIPKKNLARLLTAYASYRRNVGEGAWDLVLCGDGPLRGELETMVDQLDVRASVHFPGFVQYDDLPVYYGLASAFVHVSTVEQWGLVVNEAASAGLPLLVSNRCGCVPELVIEGRNGWILDPLDEDGMATAMKALSDDPGTAIRMGQESQEVVAAFSPQRFADGMASAVSCAQEMPAAARTGVNRLLVNLMALR